MALRGESHQLEAGHPLRVLQREKAVLDTKWKRVYNHKDLSVADMYQMHAYGQRYYAEGEGMQHVVLICPWYEGVPSGLTPKSRHVSCNGVQVDMFFSDLSNAAKSVDDVKRLIQSLVCAKG